MPQKPRDLGILESQRRNPMVLPFQAEVETQKTRLGMERNIAEVGELTNGRCVKAISRESWSPKGEQRRDAKVGNMLCFKMETQQENYQSLLIFIIEWDRTI